MKKNFVFILFFVAITALAQNQRGNIRAYFIVKGAAGIPFKAYQVSEDAINFITKNQQYSYQDKNLYYQADSIWYTPTKMETIDDFTHPEPLQDKYLRVDTIYVFMQENFKDQLVDRAYTREDEAQKYAKKWNLNYFKIPFLYRNKESYLQIAKIKKKRFGVK